MHFCNAAAVVVAADAAAAAVCNAAEFYVLVHDVQASGCLGVGSVGISQTFILLYNDDDDNDDDDNDGNDDHHILTFKFSDYG